jgi:hypothetical protein
LKAFPEFRSAIQRVDSSALWSELFSHFTAPYDVDRLPARDQTSNLIRRIYMYAIWCSGAKDWRTRKSIEIAFFESLGSSALNSKKPAYDRNVEDAVAHLGLPALKAHAVALGHLIKKEHLEKFLQDAAHTAKRHR